MYFYANHDLFRGSCTLGIVEVSLASACCFPSLNSVKN